MSAIGVESCRSMALCLSVPSFWHLRKHVHRCHLHFAGKQVLMSIPSSFTANPTSALNPESPIFRKMIRTCDVGYFVARSLTELNPASHGIARARCFVVQGSHWAEIHRADFEGKSQRPSNCEVGGLTLLNVTTPEKRRS